jgi:hypothetical protein
MLGGKTSSVVADVAGADIDRATGLLRQALGFQFAQRFQAVVRRLPALLQAFYALLQAPSF